MARNIISPVTPSNNSNLGTLCTIQNTARTLSFQKSCHGILMCLMMVAVLAGCSKRYDNMPVYMPFSLGDRENQSVGRFKSSYLGEQIDSYYRGVNPGPIGVTTFVNVDDLYTTSTFGRIYAEQVMSELAIRGYDVIELRHSDALQFLDASGEFALSRDVATLRQQRNLGGIVVGTYAVSPVRVYVNARLVDPSTSLVLSAGSVEMRKTQEIARLLRGGSSPATLERIPVRHLGYASYPMALSPGARAHKYDLEETGMELPSPALPPRQPARK